MAAAAVGTATVVDGATRTARCNDEAAHLDAVRTIPYIGSSLPLTIPLPLTHTLTLTLTRPFSRTVLRTPSTCSPTQGTLRVFRCSAITSR